MAVTRVDWIKAGASLIGSLAAASKAMIEYRKYRRDLEKVEYTRGLQRKAWQQVVDGELSSAKVGNVEIKAAAAKKAAAKTASTKASASKASAGKGATTTKAGAAESSATNGAANGVSNGTTPKDETSAKA